MEFSLYNHCNTISYINFLNCIRVVSEIHDVGTSHKAPGVKSRPGYLATKQRRNIGLVT
jgi:hypothetical protein